MKSQKGEGTKQNQAKGAFGAVERGPLFPRLHVNETEKAGPKAPPRNKMALYEQFTVPSHRLVQPSQKPTSTMYQQQYGIRELGYPYVPYYMPSGQIHGVPVYSQPSHHTSSSGAISSGPVNDVPQQNAPRHHKAGISSPRRLLRHLAETTADCMVKSLPEQKDKVAIVSEQSVLTNQAEESTTSLQSVPSHMEQPHISDVTESLQETLSTVEVGTECMGPDVKRCELTDQGKLKHASQRSLFETLTKERPADPSDNSAMQYCLQTEPSRDKYKADHVAQASTSDVHCIMQPGTFPEPNSLEERMIVNADCQSSFSSENQGVAVLYSAPINDEILENMAHKNAFKSFTMDVGKVDDSGGGLSKPSIASSEELKQIQTRNTEVSQTCQRGTHIECYSDGSIVPSTSLDPTWIIKPKDVIHAVGQQQFWKARKKLLRQQRIFSDQVFQLHKLIKIQQLLAETPGTLIDEEMQVEAREEFEEEVSLNSLEENKCKSSEAEDQPGNEWQQTKADFGKVDPGLNRCRPESLSSDGVSAWGYPSFGPWAGPMATPPGGPFSYLPFAGALPPGSAFGLPFGHSLPAPGAPVMPFGILCYDQKQELQAQVGANYGPLTAFKHDGSGTVSVNSNHMSNDVAASRYVTQYTQTNNHRLPAGGSTKDAPTGSGASVNKSPAPMQAVKASCFPGLSYHWGLHCQAGPSNADGPDNSARAGTENSSPSDAIRLDCPTPSVPSTPSGKSLGGFAHQGVEGQGQNLNRASAHRLNSLNQYNSCKNSIENEKPVTRTTIQSKHQKEASAHCPPSDGNDNSLGVNPNALELFPLVPSLSASGWSGGRGSKAGEEAEQGGIIRAIPRRAIAASKSAAGILLSLQRERQK